MPDASPTECPQPDRVPRPPREVGACRERIAAADARTGELYSSLTARIAESKTDTLKWMLAALTAQTALLAGIAKPL